MYKSTLTFRPCGACRELVLADEGCEHWNPQTSTGKRVSWRRGVARVRKPYDPLALSFLTKPGLDRQASDAVE